MSFYDADKRYENSYHTLLSGFFYAFENTYTVYSNIESGDGRPDLILEPLDKSKPAYIFELKDAKTQTPEKEVEKAVKQIEENRYNALLKRKGINEIIEIGVVFDRKKVNFSFN